MKNLNKTLKISYLVLTIFLLTACGGTYKAAKKIGQVVLNPDIQVGSNANQPSTLSMTLFADKDINKNEAGSPSPLSLKVIYLSEDSKLLEAYYEQLETNDLDEVLGKNYINNQDYTLLPDQYKPLPTIKLDKSNMYLAVVAFYEDQSKAQWKKIIKLNGLGRKYHVLIHLKSNEAVIRKEEE